MPLQLTLSMTSKDFKKIIFDKLTEVLKPTGLKKSGSTYSSSNGDLTYFINLQSSQSSTATMLKATVNIEIHSATVYKLQDAVCPRSGADTLPNVLALCLTIRRISGGQLRTKKKPMTQLLKLLTLQKI
ncbi:MAG: DUF4304 domain-containing protein [Chitinophagaceae bacterium]|nr:DUF4304 domain-containing protein [Chitinophagaceae bacterium]